VRQFDVYRNPSPRTRPIIPYFVVLQSHLIAASNLTVVAPLLRKDGGSTFTLTSVEVQFGDEAYELLVGEMTSVDTHRLSRPVGNLGDDYEDAIRRALDRIFTGF
jgi:toxin CcdB